MTQESCEALLLLREKIGRKRTSLYTLSGIGIAPLLLYATWAVGHDTALLRHVSGWLFAIFVSIFLIGHNRVLAYGKKLSHLRHEYKVVHPGLLGTAPEEKIYDVKYQFDRFTEADCRTYQKMEIAFDIAALSLFGFLGWLLFRFYLTDLFGIKL